MFAHRSVAGSEYHVDRATNALSCSALRHTAVWRNTMHSGEVVN